ncbi:MAG TPA: cupin domain-containing protein [Acidimicrobiales bacterium]|jgi:quercetin dioxygenase-like cupin family protein|nr:cupin domain-containing protein [Acidimicrobiales bacterium]
MLVQRIVTGHDAVGVDCIEQEDTVTVAAGGDVQLSELWRVVGPPTDPHSGFAPATSQGLVDEHGGIAWRYFVIPPRDDRPLHRTVTLDLLQVVAGEVVVTLESGEARLRENDCLVLQGDVHGWRNDTDQPAVLAAVMIGARGAGGPAPHARVADEPRGVAARRVVTGMAPDGRSHVVADGEPPNQLLGQGGFAMIDLWQTMAPIGAPAQGGDLAGGPVEIMPVGGGVLWRQVTVPVTGVPAARSTRPPTTHFGAGSAQRSDDPSVHRTDSIDFILVRKGSVALEIRGCEPRALHPGDVVIQRGTWHAWRALGDQPCTFSAVMITTPPFTDLTASSR